jgi:MoaA/NifB/PqqE/SkfB family radical SAM enzyme
MSSVVATIDFHVTCECSQECPYCWGPQDIEPPVDTQLALRIIARIRQLGARRIVFTGGDPLKRPDIAQLIRHARQSGLEVALSTTGDYLSAAFLADVGSCIDLVSLPLDGSTEEVNARTKSPGHFAAVLQALACLREHPSIDVKVCTPVTRHNLADVPAIARLLADYARTTRAPVFYNVFQAFPRAMFAVDWQTLLVSRDEFKALERQIDGLAGLRVHFLDHATLDRLYVMVFPDGSLVIPRGDTFQSFGPFLEIDDFESVLVRSRFDSAKHLRHSRGWARRS